MTDAARLYLARCEAIVEAAREAHDEVIGLADTPGGLLRVPLEADVGAALVAPAVAQYLGRHPQVQIELDLSPRRVDLIAEGFDLAIRLGTLPNSSLILRQVTSLAVGLYASPSYLRAHSEPHEPADLIAHSRLHLLHAHDSGDWQLRNGRRRFVVARKGAVVSANNMTMLRSLLRSGQGIGVMDELLGAEDVKSGALKRILPKWTLPPLPSQCSRRDASCRQKLAPSSTS